MSSWFDNVFDQSPNALVVLDVLQRSFAKDGVPNWPESDNFSSSLATTILDVYHDLVANKGYPLPRNMESSKAITAAIRTKLNLGPAVGYPGLAPANVLNALKKYIQTGENLKIYDWVYPKAIQLPAPTPNPIVESLSNVKWILVFGLAGYVLLQTGILKKMSPA